MTETDRVCARYEKHAPRYDRAMGFFERLLFKDARHWVCSKAHGRTLELAVGTGLNLPHYPADVELTGIELSRRCWSGRSDARARSGATPTCGSAT